MTIYELYEPKGTKVIDATIGVRERDAVLDIELPAGGEATIPVPPGFQGFAYVLDGEATFGANRRPARPAQLVVLGPGGSLRVTDAAPGTRYLLMAGKPIGEPPRFNGPFVD